MRSIWIVFIILAGCGETESFAPIPERPDGGWPSEWQKPEIPNPDSRELRCRGYSRNEVSKDGVVSYEIRLDCCNSNADCADSPWGPYCLPETAPRHLPFASADRTCQLCNPQTNAGCGQSEECVTGLQELSPEAGWKIHNPGHVPGGDNLLRAVNWCEPN